MAIAKGGVVAKLVMLRGASNYQLRPGAEVPSLCRESEISSNESRIEFNILISFAILVALSPMLQSSYKLLPSLFITKGIITFIVITRSTDLIGRICEWLKFVPISGCGTSFVCPYMYLHGEWDDLKFRHFRWLLDISMCRIIKWVSGCHADQRDTFLLAWIIVIITK